MRRERLNIKEDFYLFIYLFFEIEFHHVGQAGLELLISSGLPTSASQDDGITDMSHCTLSNPILFISIFLEPWQTHFGEDWAPGFVTEMSIYPNLSSSCRFGKLPDSGLATEDGQWLCHPMTFYSFESAAAVDTEGQCQGFLITLHCLRYWGRRIEADSEAEKGQGFGSFIL